MMYKTKEPSIKNLEEALSLNIISLLDLSFKKSWLLQDI